MALALPAFCSVLPLAEILVDFNDKLKSMTRGYGSMDYEHSGYRAAKMVKMDMLIAGDPVEAADGDPEARQAMIFAFVRCAGHGRPCA
mgnify:CR=1 FL=1